MTFRRRRTFELHVLPRPSGQYGLALFELNSKLRKKHQAERKLVSRIWGTPMQAILDRILEALKRTGARASDLRPTRKRPFTLDEESGVRLGLLFMAVKPLRKLGRIESISSAVSSMGMEEAYYWFSKCSDPNRDRRAQKAFRTLEA